MLNWYNDKEIVIKFNKLPKIVEINRNNSAFINYIFGKNIYMLLSDIIAVIYYKNQIYQIKIERGYKWDGANVPLGFWWLIGKPSYDKFKIPSMIHDKVCENHHLINNDRYLSSLILAKLLQASNVNNFKIKIMFFFTDLYQRFKNWEK